MPWTSTYGRLLMGPASLPCLVFLLVLPVAAAKILAVKALISLGLASLPCQPKCLVSPNALSAQMPCQPKCLVSPNALAAQMPWQP